MDNGINRTQDRNVEFEEFLKRFRTGEGSNEDTLWRGQFMLQTLTENYSKVSVRFDALRDFVESLVDNNGSLTMKAESLDDSQLMVELSRLVAAGSVANVIASAMIDTTSSSRVASTGIQAMSPQPQPIQQLQPQPQPIQQAQPQPVLQQPQPIPQAQQPQPTQSQPQPVGTAPQPPRNPPRPTA